MRSKNKLIGAAVAASLALAACAQTPAPTSPPPAAVSNVVLDDQTIAQIKRGETNMTQVRSLISATPIVNYQAGHEIWIYQGVPAPASTQARTVTVQYDDRGVVRNVGVTDLK
jgi:outer membrane protein assembly factor BamE (lipoprotein component of BamABCDE complex)